LDEEKIIIHIHFCGSQSSDTEQSSADMNNEQSSEVGESLSPPTLLVSEYRIGFICPQCMKSHNSAEELFKHYDPFYFSDLFPQQFYSKSYRLYTAFQEDLTLLRQEVQDLQASLKEERWFSGELKKELDKVQGHLKQVIHFRFLPDASSEESILEMKLNEAETEMFNIKQMKDLFEQKAAQLATEIVDIKSRYDEEKSLREVVEQKLSSLTQDLQRERLEKEKLNTELMQRPGVEDVDVLKKELVQVQTLMDKMSREREEESERLKNQYEELKVNYTTSETTISQLKAELEKGPQEAAVYTQQIHQLQSNLNNLQQQSQRLSENLSRKEKENQELEERVTAEQASKKGLQASLHQRELELQELQARALAVEASLARAQSELGERGEEAARLRREVSELEVKQQELKAEKKQLLQQREEKETQGQQQQSEISQLHIKLLEAERQLGEVQGRLKEQRQLSGEKLKDREQQAADLQLKLSRSEEQLKEMTNKGTDLQHQLDKAKQQQQELQTLHQSTNGKLREAQNDLEQVLRQIGDKDQKIQNLEALLQKSRDCVSQLEAEREDLCAKIQAGEGEAAILNQLQEKNHTLQEQITQLTEKLKNQAESHKQAQENLHEQVQEQKTLLRSVQDRCQALENSNSELNTQLTECREKAAQLDTQLKAKTEMLLSAEAAKSAQRADLQNHLETAQHALQDKQQELSKSKAQLEELNSRLQEKREQCTQLESSLKETRDKLLSAEQRGDALEGQAKVNRPLRAHEKEAATLKEDLKKKLATLSDVQKQLEITQREKTGLQECLDKVTQDGQTRQAEFDKNIKRLTADLQKVQQEKETQTNELSKAKEELGKATKALQESQSRMEKERKTAEASIGEKVGFFRNSSVSVLFSHIMMMMTSLRIGNFLCVCVCMLACVCVKFVYLFGHQAEEEDKLKEQLSSLAKDLSSERSCAAALEKSLEEQKQILATLQSDYYGKESELSATHQDLKVAEDKLTLAQEELVTNRNQLGRQGSVIQEQKTAQAALQMELSQRDKKLKQQEEVLSGVQKQQVSSLVVEELKKCLSEMEELKGVRSGLEKERSRLGAELKLCHPQELKELQAGKQLLIQQKLEVQGRVEAAQASIEQEQREHQATRDSVSRREGELKVLEVKAREELQKHKEDSEAKLGLQLTALNENVATLKREWQTSQRRVGELEKQTDELRGEIAVLEATVQNNQDERRALLERCVKGEGEIERLQAKVVEIRRKLDDTTAAMQELGRENQSLQIKQSQSLTRKWAEDHEVQNCMACGKGFSVTVRKHHCRHCGNIFCAECSAKNAMTPSSKKAVRVCDVCFEELQG
uniref:FYVE-type domain-containing protein n=1 Tax=Denticeps clupeoides TaxID=299321 RepID=A0AAY4D6G3_9TELE